MFYKLIYVNQSVEEASLYKLIMENKRFWYFKKVNDFTDCIYRVSKVHYKVSISCTDYTYPSPSPKLVIKI